MLDLVYQLLLHEKWKAALLLLDQIEQKEEAAQYLRALIYRMCGNDLLEQQLLDTVSSNNAYFSDRRQWYAQDILERYAPRPSHYWPQGTVPKQETLDQLCIVLAADHNYFGYLRQCLESIQKTRLYSNIPICIVDCGLTKEEKAYLSQHFNIHAYVDPGYDIEIDVSYALHGGGSVKVQPVKPAVKGLLVRPYLRKHFPAFRYYFWIDCDTWVQDDRALDDFVTLCERQGFAASENCSKRTKWHLYYYVPIVSHSVKEFIKDLPILFGGAFCCDANTGFFEDWQACMEETVKDHGFWHVTDEFTATYVFYKRGYQELVPFHRHFCFFKEGFPAISQDPSILLSPMTRKPLGIIHFAGGAYKNWQHVPALDFQQFDQLAEDLQVVVLNTHKATALHEYDFFEEHGPLGYNLPFYEKHIPFHYYIFPESEKQKGKVLLADMLKEIRKSPLTDVVEKLINLKYQEVAGLCEEVPPEKSLTFPKHTVIPAKWTPNFIDWGIVTWCDQNHFALCQNLIESLKKTSTLEALPLYIVDCGLTEGQTAYFKQQNHTVISADFMLEKYTEITVKQKTYHTGLWSIPYCLKPHIGQLCSHRYVLFMDPSCWIQDEQQILNLLQHAYQYGAGFCAQLDCAGYAFYEDLSLPNRVVLNNKACGGVNIFGVDTKSLFYEQWVESCQSAVFGLDQVNATKILYDLAIPLLPQQTCYHCELMGYPMTDHAQILYDPITSQCLGSICLEYLENTAPDYLGLLRRKHTGPCTLEKNQMISGQFRTIAKEYQELLHTEETVIAPLGYLLQ